MNFKQSITVLQHKQRGATLFTSLVFLTLMTIVGVSAAKIASLDTIVAGNNQQTMLVFQQADKTLDSFSNPIVVISAIDANNGTNDNWDETIAPSPNGGTSIHAERRIANRNIDYNCKGGGKSTSTGGGGT